MASEHAIKVPTKSKVPPLVRMDKFDPTKQRFMVDLTSIYCNGIEYSLEELRARKYFANKKKKEEKDRTARLEKELAEVKAKLELLMQEKARDGKVNVKSTPDTSKSGVKVRDPDNIIVAAAVSGFVVNNENDENDANDINGANGTNGTLSQEAIVKAQQPPVFEIFQDPTATITNFIGPITMPEPPKFEIFSDETTKAPIVDDTVTSVIPVMPPPKPNFEIFAEPTEKLENNNCKHDPAKDPIESDDAFEQSFVPNFHQGETEAFTFLVVSETEFISAKKPTSTPAIVPSKKACSRIAQADQFVPPPEPRKSTVPVNNKLDTIVETSREYKSSSSSGSSGAHTTTRGFSTTAFQTTNKRSRFFSENQENNLLKDPFDLNLVATILEEIEPSLKDRPGYIFIKSKVPNIKTAMASSLKFGSDTYIVSEFIDEGAYAKVYSAQIDNLNDNSDTNADIATQMFSGSFALKVSKPANMWEFYICDELRRRLSQRPAPDVEISIMSASPAVEYIDGSILVDEFCPNGTLTKIVNHYRRAKKCFPKAMAAYFTLELLLIIKQVHMCQIIHGDMKPDNVLVLSFPSREDIARVLERTSTIKLIDFGRSIDMTQFPEGTVFSHVVETKGSACPEMLDKKTWTYETDWFGLLDCLHIMIFQEYIDITKEHNRWMLTRKINKRIHMKDLWDPLFDQLLNVQENEDKACPPIVDKIIGLLADFVRKDTAQVMKESMEMENFIESSK